ncbi:FAD-binding protein [Rhodopseudomonas palustris]|uniref:FAD-binding protein n=1 Tax=Rhodopseudomonas palustris TaxID=1076 RepID=A0A0D7DWU2_RHOPL|nr:FAD-binding protein [Rhodopseudomonas palustris]
MLTVAAITPLPSRMLRFDLTSPELGDFVSLGHDDHVKLIFPAGADGKPVMRDFTPRRFDRARGSLTIDFALHEAGPATQWAASARLGDTLEIGGPRGSSVVPDDFDWYALIGDETALPAIGRRVEELRPGVAVASFVITADGAAQQLATAAAWTPHWIARDPSSDDAAQLLAALAAFSLPEGEGFVWIAAEAAVARALRREIVEQRGHPKAWTKAAGYWKRGEPDAHETIED